MTEADLGADLEQVRLDRRRRGLRIDPEPLGRAPHEQRLAHRIGRGELQQPPGVGRERVEPPPEAVLDAAGQPDRRREREAARQLGRAHPARQLQQGERVAARLGDDPVAHALVDPARDDRLEQRARVGLVEPPQRQLRQARQPRLVARLAHAEHERDRLRQQPARDEPEHLGGGVVEPLEVVHDAQQRLLLGHRGHQAERRPARRGSGRADRRTRDPARPSSATCCGSGSTSSRSAVKLVSFRALAAALLMLGHVHGRQADAATAWECYVYNPVATQPSVQAMFSMA